jgi:hypothetical protein
LSGTGNVLAITPRTVSVSGTTIADREWTGTKAAGVVTPGTIVGLINGDVFTLQASAGEYSSPDVGTHTSTVTYTLNSVNGSNIGNYSVASGTVTGRITPARAEFAVTPVISASQFSIDYANSDTLTVSATTRTAGTVSFQVDVNGAGFTSIAACPTVSVNPPAGQAVAATCVWGNPTVGNLVVKSTLTPSDLTANQVETQEFAVQIVAKPRITNIAVRGKTGDAAKTGSPGNTLIITGENFVGVNDVKFNGVSAPSGTFRGTATQISVPIPGGATTGKITVSTQFGGSVVSADTLTVTS